MLQCLLLSAGQVFLKLAVSGMDTFRFSLLFFRGLLTNGYLLASGVCMIAATLLWLYILKHFDFSVAYPVTGFGYVLGVLAAVYVFRETVPPLRWVGVFFILVGVGLIAAPGLKAQNLRPASPGEQEAMKTRIEEASRKMTTLVCRFTQVKTLSILNEEMRSEGKLYYQRDRRLRWEYLSPYRYLFLLNDNTLVMQTEDSRQVVDVQAGGFFREIIQVMMNGISGSGLSDLKRFDIRYYQRQGDTPWEVHLLPRQRDLKQLFSVIRLVFDAGDYSVVQVELKEPGGDTTLFHLLDKQVNVDLKDDTFSLEGPSPARMKDLHPPE
jgi:outer membrane lipoprotein-sorting protein